MTSSLSKRTGSAQERAIAKMLGGVRVGMDGGPVDVIVPGYMNVQVKNLKMLPSLFGVVIMLNAIPVSELLRSVVVVQRAGQGKRGLRTITFDLDEWVAWHGNGDSTLGADPPTDTAT